MAAQIHGELEWATIAFFTKLTTSISVLLSFASLIVETYIDLSAKAGRNTASMIVYRGGFTADLDSVEIGLDDFGMNLEDMAVVWIDDHPQPVDVGRAEGFDAREARQALARGRLAQGLVHAEIVGVAVG